MVKPSKRLAAVLRGLGPVVGLIAAASLALGMAGCAGSPGRGSAKGLFASSEKAAVKRAAARDSFPTAKQAGIVSNASAQ